MNDSKTFSAVGVDWSREKFFPVLNFTGYLIPIGAYMDRSLAVPMSSPDIEQHYRIRVKGNQAQAFYLLMRNGSLMAQAGDVYMVSKWELDILKQSSVDFDIL
jgi:hypothetical protein